MKPQIFIFSRGRAKNVITLKSLNKTMRACTKLVVYQEEQEEYQRAHPDIEVIVANGPKLARRRQEIYQKYSGKMIFLDDDLSFLELSILDDKIHRTEMDTHSVNQMINEVHLKLDQYSAVTLNTLTAPPSIQSIQQEFEENSRMTQFLAYNKDLINFPLDFTKVLDAEDFYATLQLLTHGLKNYKFTKYAICSSGSQTKGGCSIYRTNQTHNESMLILKELYPDFVKLREVSGFNKEGIRLKATIYWKKAFNSFKKQNCIKF